jgi:NADPH:quinone reductase-like Zn-dependent oxidoreductase
MRCIRIHEHGGLEKLLYEDAPAPKIGADEALVNVKATSVNHLDIWVRNGLPGVRFPLPMIPGVDAAGIVAEKGEAVRHVNVGDRVVVAQGISCGHCVHCLNGNDNLCRDYKLIGEHRDGADAEYLAVPGRNVIPLSGAISFESAAAAALVFLTARRRCARDRCEQWCRQCRRSDREALRRPRPRDHQLRRESL